MSGIHYNMELGANLVTALFEESDYTSLIAFKKRPLPQISSKLPTFSLVIDLFVWGFANSRAGIS